MKGRLGNKTACDSRRGKDYRMTNQIIMSSCRDHPCQGDERAKCGHLPTCRLNQAARKASSVFLGTWRSLKERTICQVNLTVPVFCPS